MILQFSMRPPLIGCKQQGNGKHLWMKHCGRQTSAGCSVRWPLRGCQRTGEWTVLMACSRRLQVKKQQWPLKTAEREWKGPVVTTFLFRLALSLSLLSCRQSCVTQVATRPGRISSQEDFLPTQLEHLHIAQFKGQNSEVKLNYYYTR